MITGGQHIINGFGRDLPPAFAHVAIYFDQQGMSEKEATFFFQQQITNNWTTNSGTPIRNWKTVACNWIFNFKEAKKLQQRLIYNKL